GERRRARRVSAFAAHEHERQRASGPGDASLLLARAVLDDFLRTLDDDKRAVFVLAAREGQAGREIAEALGINSNTAHSRLRAARKQFCSYFELPSSREEIATRTRPLRERPEQPSAQACARSRALLIAGLGKGTLVEAGGGLGLAVLGQGLLGKLAAVAGLLLLIGVGVIAAGRDGNVEVERREPVRNENRQVVSPSAAIVELAEAEPDPDVAEPEPIAVVAP